MCGAFLTFFRVADYSHRHVKKPTGFRASGTAPSYSYASRKQRTSVHMNKIMAKKAEEDKAKAKRKARDQKAFGGGGRTAAGCGSGSPLFVASPAKKRFTLNRTSSSGSSGGGTVPPASPLMAAASPAKKRLTLNRTSSGAGAASGGGLFTEKKKKGSPWSGWTNMCRVGGAKESWTNSRCQKETKESQ